MTAALTLDPDRGKFADRSNATIPDPVTSESNQEERYLSNYTVNALTSEPLLRVSLLLSPEHHVSEGGASSRNVRVCLVDSLAL